MKNLILLLTLLLVSCSRNIERTIIVTPPHPNTARPTITSSPTATSESSTTSLPTATINPTQPQAIVIQLPAVIYVLPNPVWTATAVPPPASNSGYLWWVNDYTPLREGEIRVNVPSVVIIGHQHQNGPNSQWGPDNELDKWIANGEACKTPTPVSYILRLDTDRPNWATGVEVTSGPCKGFVGWVYPMSTHSNLP